MKSNGALPRGGAPFDIWHCAVESWRKLALSGCKSVRRAGARIAFKSRRLVRGLYVGRSTCRASLRSSDCVADGADDGCVYLSWQCRPVSRSDMASRARLCDFHRHPARQPDCRITTCAVCRHRVDNVSTTYTTTYVGFVRDCDVTLRSVPLSSRDRRKSHAWSHGTRRRWGIHSCRRRNHQTITRSFG